MKNIFFTLITLLFFISHTVYAQSKTGYPKLKGPEPTPLNCKQYRDGTFKITLKKTTIIKRSGATESDYPQGSTIPIVYKVKWKNDCTYTLTPTRETLKKHPYIKKNTVLTVEIVQQNTNSFTQVVSANYTKAKTNCEVYKIK
ncbi:MAG: hypothetical protein JWQ06_307 [Mucilaginibacter sp.]|nr:hypothetical protein [Mucilaginibacter sp.]